jgi:hypothetical protein
MIIEDQSQLDSWLDTCFGLEDVIIKSLDPAPQEPGDLEKSLRVCMQFSLQVGGGIMAGETRLIRDIEIIAEAIEDYSISRAEGFIPGNCCAGVELIDVTQGIGFTLDVPEILKVVCKTLHIEEQEDREEIVAPRLSKTEFRLTARSPQLPTPDQWIAVLRAQGFDVVWRYIYSDQRLPSQVPSDDYSGWFLQLRTRLNENHAGLFFKFCSCKQEQLSMTLELLDSEIQEIWIAAGRYLARLPDVKVFCGNSELGKEDWLAYLNQCGEKE